jgi:hypothetical protein
MCARRLLTNACGAAVLATAALSSARAAALHVVAVEVYEVDRLSPVDIGRAVPTGLLTVAEVEELNLPTWARNVTQACIYAFGDTTDPPSAHLHAISEIVRSLVDPDLAVHACLINRTSSCSTGGGPTEDKNRFIDLRVAYNGMGETSTVRLTAAEDAAKAVNFPLSDSTHSVRVWYVSGTRRMRPCLGVRVTLWIG